MAMPYEDYLRFCNKLMYLIKFSFDAEKLDKPYYPADEETYKLLYCPPLCTELPEIENRHIVDCLNPETYQKALRQTIHASINTLQNYQNQLLGALRGTLMYYVEGEKTAEEAISDIEAIYLSTLYVSQNSLYELCKCAEYDVDENMHRQFIKEMGDAFKSYGENVITTDKKTEKMNFMHRQEIKKYKQSVEKISKSLGHEISESQKLKNEIEERQRINKKNRIELANLRELIFQYQNNEEEPPEPNIEFPIRTTKNIYSLGGLPSWINKMKELAPDVKYLSSDQNIRLDNKLDKADEIWFQIHGLSHAQYYSATAIADKNGIPCKYFIRQSPANCAAQLIKQ